MDWTLAIDKNRAALVRLVTVLCATVGLTGDGGFAPQLKRFVRSNVLRLLRSAESAVRRLVVAEARTLETPEYKKRPAPTKPIPRGNGKDRAPVFPLIDPRKRFGTHGRKVAPQTGPNAPRLTLIGWDERIIEPLKPEPQPDDLMGAQSIGRRVLALKNALETLPKQAKRLMRLQARRKLHAMRPGQPPGFRERVRFEVDEVLRECQWLAQMALKAPDTS